jgi:hypothetical protein
MTPVERLVRAIFRRLEPAGVDRVVLRNYEGLPRDNGNDLDFMVRPRQRRLAEAAVYLRRDEDPRGHRLATARSAQEVDP